MRLLLIDNFDSFVYNLKQSVEKLGHEVEVFRNNMITAEDVRAGNYDRIVISPGPGHPSNIDDFGACRGIITKFAGNLPILGVCLGFQGIVEAFGGRIIPAPKPMHGKTSTITHNRAGIFSGIKNPLSVMRYHSLIADESSLPSCLEITAKTDNIIMAVQHKTYPVFGLQFHPESLLTEQGDRIIENFCNASVIR